MMFFAFVRVRTEDEHPERAIAAIGRSTTMRLMIWTPCILLPGFTRVDQHADVPCNVSCDNDYLSQKIKQQEYAKRAQSRPYQQDDAVQESAARRRRRKKRRNL